MLFKKTILIGIIFLLSFVTIGFNPQKSSAESSNSYLEDFKITTHNVYFLSTKLYPNWGQGQRADLISQAEYIKNNDIVIFNEVFDVNASKQLLSNLEGLYPHQTPVLGRSRSGWDKTEGNYSDIVPENGGVAVISKWPIAEKIQYVFQRGGGMDNLSNKGFVYVKIMKNDKAYHVIGTHLQADDSLIPIETAMAIRATQIKEIQTFIKNKNIPENEVVFIGGDMNVKYESTEYNNMISNLNVSPLTNVKGHFASWDPTTNSIANYNYPNESPQYLDYIFVDKDHANPKSWSNEIKKVKSPEWSVTSWWKTYTYNDYSDHYPVFATTNNQ
ncbi:sphingomyelin phosphodiesterase [Enterococcus sp. DIV0869a]|uniref:Sphingomyelin phosphodiesterase n=1 Tax=Candidatus Enterococcus ikei TaxID=2815326 RepID=A0ABS3GXK0_9ENTE|nr:sphingomyelin phosphodiesterase [Enterococcus sp. DIV0869a]